jgi:protein TonB
MADPAGGPVAPPERIESSYVSPVYPDAARMARVEGEVRVLASISTDGIVCRTEIAESDNPGWGFEESAIEAIEQWEYLPAMQGGKPVAYIITVIVTYTLQGPSSPSTETSLVGA